MAFATKAMTFASVTLAAVGTSVAAPIPDNCYRIRVFNLGGFPLLVGFETAPTPLVLGVNAGLVPANGFIEYDLGDLTRRGSLSTSLAYDAPAGTPVPATLYIEYHNTQSGLYGIAP